MNIIKTIRCETIEELVLALQKLLADKKLPVFGDTPIRQGMGDGCVVAVHQDAHDTCISIEEFDYAHRVGIVAEPIIRNGSLQASCMHCKEPVHVNYIDISSDCVFVTCGKCKQVTPVDIVHTHDGYRVGDPHEFNNAEAAA